LTTGIVVKEAEQSKEGRILGTGLSSLVVAVLSGGVRRGGQGRSNNMPTCQLVRIRKGMEYQVREPSLHLDDQISLAS